jgi:hypothetical protein
MDTGEGSGGCDGFFDWILLWTIKMIDNEEMDVERRLARQARIEARQFFRLFRSEDGRAVLAALKRDFGWDAAAPPAGTDGEIPISRLRAWTGSRGVIATILYKCSQGEKLTEHTNDAHDEDW